MFCLGKIDDVSEEDDQNQTSEDSEEEISEEEEEEESEPKGGVGSEEEEEESTLKKRKVKLSNNVRSKHDGTTTGAGKRQKLTPSADVKMWKKKEKIPPPTITLSNSAVRDMSRPTKMYIKDRFILGKEKIKNKIK